MAWRRLGDKPLSESMMVSLPTHICVTRPQWVKTHFWWFSFSPCMPLCNSSHLVVTVTYLNVSAINLLIFMSSLNSPTNIMTALFSMHDITMLQQLHLRCHNGPTLVCPYSVWNTVSENFWLPTRPPMEEGRVNTEWSIEAMCWVHLTIFTFVYIIYFFMPKVLGLQIDHPYGSLDRPDDLEVTSDERATCYFTHCPEQPISTLTGITKFHQPVWYKLDKMAVFKVQNYTTSLQEWHTCNKHR